jgi:Leucine-rich repeat (LRR) protein
MKTIFISFLLCFLIGNLLAQNTNNAAAIRQQMAQIRKSTNWDDPTAAKKANAQIQELSKKMMMTGPDPANLPPNLTEEQKEEAKKESADDKMKMWGQIIKGVEQGENADILLAEPVREEIKEEYKKDDEPVTSSPMFQELMTMLFIDMSQPTVQTLIGQMENFKSIKTLIITGGKYGAPVNLEMLVSKAKNYPLVELYIINFRQFVTAVPKTVSSFKNLELLALYNNSITQLPPEISEVVSLKKLYVDLNPLTTLVPEIGLLNKLDTLGAVQTSLPESEILRISESLPNCKILHQ